MKARRYFRNIDDLKAAFAQHHIPIQTHDGKLNDIKYVIVAAFPYSGLNAIDVYCYVDAGASWRLYSLVFLTNSKTQKVDVRQEADVVDVLHDGAIAFSLHQLQ